VGAASGGAGAEGRPGLGSASTNNVAADWRTPTGLAVSVLRSANQSDG
jgi:hypothetical protein